MPTKKLLVAAFLCATAICQQPAPQLPAALPAKPSDLSISCSIDTSTRVAQVTILNHTDKRIRLRFGGPYMDFDADVRTTTGRRLPHHEDAPTWPLQARAASIAIGDLVPKAQHSEKVPLEDLVDIPKAGGKFRVRIGRGLAALPNDVWQLDPKEIVWCKPMGVTFPPLK